MRMIAVKNIQPGMVLGKSIYGFNNKLLLGAGYRLTPEIKTRLLDKGYNYVYIMEEGTEEVIPEDIISEEVRLQAKTMVADKAGEVQKHFKFKDLSRSKVFDLLTKGYLKEVNITYDMKRIVDDILRDIAAADSKYMNSLMLKSKDMFLLDHSINTTVMAILIGYRYRFSKTELSDLALGTFLHDFGKIVIDKLREAGSGTAAEELIREHPTFGYMIIHNSQGSSPIIAQIVNQHHEHQDGSGYPIGLIGDNLPPLSTVKREMKGKIFRLAEICAVVNAYDNLLLNPHHHRPNSPADAIKQLVIDAGTKWNKHVVQTLVSVVPHYPVGAFVKIENILDPTIIGYTGVVAKINEDDLNKPVIILLYDRSHRKIKPRRIDTSKLKHVELRLVL